MTMAHEVTRRPRERRRDAKRSHIVEAAMEAVTSGGFGSLSMNKLADAVDFTPGALYRYFDSKDALLSALVSCVLDEVNERLRGAVLEAGDDPLARVFALARGYHAFSIEQPNRFGLLAMSMADPNVLLGTPESADPVAQSVASTLSPLAEALGAAASIGQLEAGNALERTLVVFGAIQGALQLRKQARIAPELIDVERLSLHAVRTLLRGWGAEPRALDSALESVVALDLTASAGGAS